MKIKRLLSITFYMLSNRRSTTVRLAERFNVSVRTILRDLDDLSLAGIPVYTKQGKNGGVFLLDDFDMNISTLSSDEFINVLSILDGAKDISSGLDFSGLSDRLLTGNGNTDDKKVVMDFSPMSWNRSNYVNKKWDEIKLAIDKSFEIEIDYINKQGVSHRTVQPMTLVYRLTDWYLYGYCHMREDYRVFKLSRITELVQTDREFIVRDKQWESDYFTQSMDDGDRNVEFEVRVEKSKIMMAIELFTYDNVELLPSGEAIAKASWPEMQIIDSLLKLGSGIKIISPDWLRERYIIEAKKMIENNLT